VRYRGARIWPAYLKALRTVRWEAGDRDQHWIRVFREPPAFQSVAVRWRMDGGFEFLTEKNWTSYFVHDMFF
jgi:hypothetical protein